MTEAWGTERERQIRKRIHLSVATYAYEVMDTPILSDALWDIYASEIDRNMGTGHPLIDEFFAVHFSPMTGMWIHHHPELDKIKAIYERYYRTMQDHFEGLQRAGKLKTALR